MTEERKAKRDPAININQVELLGRVAKDPMIKADLVRVPIMVPTWGRDGTNWVGFGIDVVGDKIDKAKGATAGDFFRCTCFLVDRPIEDDNGDMKTVKHLQLDPFRELGLMPGEADEVPFINPPYHGICYSRILLAGRNFIRKKQLEEGKDTPIVRDSGNGPYCYVNLRYEDPFQAPPQGDEKYFKNMFIDFAVNGKPAEIVGQWCKNRAQIVARGELVRKECNFTAHGGKTPKEPAVRLIPGGFSFVNLGQGSGQARTPEPAKDYEDPKDTSGVAGLDDDIPF